MSATARPSTPPPSTPRPSTPRPPTPAPSTLRRVLLTVGSIIVIGVLVYLVVAVVSAANRPDASRDVTIDTAFDTISITSEVADVTLRFGDVRETLVTFEQRGANRNMSFDAAATGGTLTVAVVEHGAAPWFFGDVSQSPRLTVTLPDSFAGRELTVALETDVGDVVLDGDFGDIDTVSTAGDIRLDGSATRVGVETTAGDITAPRLSVQGEVSINTTVGEANLSLTTVPSRLDITSTVGDIDVRLPSGDYRIDTATNVGDVTIDAESDPDADTILRLETTTGDITVGNQS
jgi:hypothetical protein